MPDKDSSPLAGDLERIYSPQLTMLNRQLTELSQRVLTMNQQLEEQTRLNKGLQEKLEEQRRLNNSQLNINKELEEKLKQLDQLLILLGKIAPPPQSF
jgi:uncharacterized protein YjcR